MAPENGAPLEKRRFLLENIIIQVHVSFRWVQYQVASKDTHAKHDYSIAILRPR